MSIDSNSIGDNIVLIPEGLYEAVYISHEVCFGGWGKKVRIDFRIISLGVANGVELSGWYNIADGELGKGGRIVLLRNHKLTNELHIVLELTIFTLDLSPAMLATRVIEVRVVTVDTNGRKQKLAAPLQYSKVESMVRSKTIGMDPLHIPTDPDSSDPDGNCSLIESCADPTPILSPETKPRTVVLPEPDVFLGVRPVLCV